jgi:hypothetical protein
MAMTVTLRKKCPQCHGTGFFQPSSGVGSSPIPCNWPGCGEDGVVGQVTNGSVTFDPGFGDVIDKCNDILDKCADILEEVQGG